MDTKIKRCCSEQIILSVTSDNVSKTSASSDDSLSTFPKSKPVEWLKSLTYMMQKLPDLVHYRPSDYKARPYSRHVNFVFSLTLGNSAAASVPG